MGLYGTIASLFGPIKYGILPDHLARSELPSGNALVEGGTFLAILIGTIVAGIAAKDGGDPIHFAWLMMVTSVACWIASRFIPPTGEGAPHLVVRRNIFASTWALIKYIRGEPRLWWGAMVSSWFWLVGALVLSLLPPLVTFNIGGSEGVVTIFLTIFSVAVAIGSGLAAWLAHGRIVLLPTLVAGVLLGLFSLDLAWTSSAIVAATSPLSISEFFAAPHSIHVAIDLAGLAISGGLFIVPTFSAVQAWADADQRARVIAAVNVLNAVFMVVGAIVLAVLQKLGLSTPLLFALIGVANLIVAVIIARTLPTSWLNDLLSIVFRTLYRLEVTGLENVAKAGHNAIIAMNHVSFLDPPVAMAILPKRPVFAVDSGIAQQWWIQPFLPFVRTMALDPLKPMALRTIINAVKDGNMLVIFPEGRITITGSLMKIYDGAAMIADKSDAMVVPVRIDGPEKTIVQPLEEHAGAPPAVPEDQGDDPRAGEAQRRSGTQRPQAAAGGGRGALRHHVEFDVRHHLDRSHCRRSRHRGGQRARRQMAGNRGPDQRAADLQASPAGDEDPRRQADAACARRARHRRHAADLQWRRRDRAGADVRRACSGDDQLHVRGRQYPRRLPCRASRHHPHRARFRREGETGKARRRRSRNKCKSSIWKTFARR